MDELIIELVELIVGILACGVALGIVAFIFYLLGSRKKITEVTI